MMKLPLESEVTQVVYNLPQSPQACFQYALSTEANLATPSRKRHRKRLVQVSDTPIPLAVPQQKHTTISAPLPPDTSLNCLQAPPTTVKTPLNPSRNIKIYDYNVESHRMDDCNIIAASMDNQKYLFFVEAVSTDQCSFLQLTADVFVANDWNMAKDKAMVCIQMTCCMHNH